MASFKPIPRSSIGKFLFMAVVDTQQLFKWKPYTFLQATALAFTGKES
jgi:hypothetical protein